MMQVFPSFSFLSTTWLPVFPASSTESAHTVSCPWTPACTHCTGEVRRAHYDVLLTEILWYAHIVHLLLCSVECHLSVCVHFFFLLLVHVQLTVEDQHELKAAEGSDKRFPPVRSLRWHRKLALFSIWYQKALSMRNRTDMNSPDEVLNWV